MLEMIKGCVVACADELSEQYDKQENGFMANVNASKIEEVVRHFISIQTEPLFFILELPTNGKEEEKLRRDDTEPFHRDIYYIDGLDIKRCLALLDKYGKLLINDGMSSFGFGIESFTAEIMVNQYNIVTIFANPAEKYNNFFPEHNIPRVEECVCAWDTFTKENFGMCNTIETDGILVYDLPELLKDWGIYLAERREE